MTSQAGRDFPPDLTIAFLRPPERTTGRCRPAPADPDPAIPQSWRVLDNVRATGFDDESLYAVDKRGEPIRFRADVLLVDASSYAVCETAPSASHQAHAATTTVLVADGVEDGSSTWSMAQRLLSSGCRTVHIVSSRPTRLAPGFFLGPGPVAAGLVEVAGAFVTAIERSGNQTTVSVERPARDQLFDLTADVVRFHDERPLSGRLMLRPSHARVALAEPAVPPTRPSSLQVLRIDPLVTESIDGMRQCLEGARRYVRGEPL